MVLNLATAVVPHEIGDPPHHCVDDRQNRDAAPHRQPYLAAAGYVIAVASEYPIGKGPVCFKHKVAGSSDGGIMTDNIQKAEATNAQSAAIPCRAHRSQRVMRLSSLVRPAEGISDHGAM